MAIRHVVNASAEQSRHTRCLDDRISLFCILCFELERIQVSILLLALVRVMLALVSGLICYLDTRVLVESSVSDFHIRIDDNFESIPIPQDLWIIWHVEVVHLKLECVHMY